MIDEREFCDYCKGPFDNDPAIIGARRTKKGVICGECVDMLQGCSICLPEIEDTNAI